LRSADCLGSSVVVDGCSQAVRSSAAGLVEPSLCGDPDGPVGVIARNTADVQVGPTLPGPHDPEDRQPPHHRESKLRPDGLCGVGLLGSTAGRGEGRP
jgi:hypothetical protein